MAVSESCWAIWTIKQGLPSVLGVLSMPAYAGVLGTMRAWAARAMGFAKGAGVQLEQRQQVKDAYAKHQSALTELTGKLAELQRNLGQDFGPSGVFAALLDRYVFWHHHE